MTQKILSLAPAAKRWLEQSQQAVILHVFDPVCNMINEEGEVFSLVGRFVGNGPFSGLTHEGRFTSWISAESKVEIEDKVLRIDGVEISFEDAAIWEPKPNWKAISGKSTEILQANEVIEGLLKEQAEAESFAYIVLPLSDGNEGISATHKKASLAIEKLLPAILAEDSEVMRESAAAIGGLGAGLTPAGDDFLVGLMHALWATRPETAALAVSLVLAKAAIPRTNSLSAAWLKVASQGEAGEPWHELIEAIAAINDEAVERAVMRILPTGHSSGADALGGFIALTRLILAEEVRR
jgi:hypothetical protein